MFIRYVSLIFIILMASWSITSHAGNNNNNNGPECTHDSCNTNNNEYNNTDNHGGIGLGGTGGTGLGFGVGVGGSADSTSNSSSKSDADATAISGSASGAASKSNSLSGSNSGGNKISIGGDDYEASKIPVGSSIAAGANGNSDCTIYKSKSANIFFASFAFAGHERDYICTANTLGLPEVAIQMTCNADSAFKKAFNQVAQLNGTPYCID